MIRLSDLWPILTPENYKLHFARWNGDSQPLDVWLRDKSEWQGWQEYRPARNDFNRPLIFTLIQFHHEIDTWLFGGVYRVLDRHEDRYQVELTNEGANFVGRLKLLSPYRERATRVNFENHYPALQVGELLREPYAGRTFPGFENIELSFNEMEALVRADKPDWRSALSSVKGVYLITDVMTNKRYVGSAYGPQGVWSRWSDYASSGHGGNAVLRDLVREPALSYCRRAFHFALLETHPARTTDDVILYREAFWKRALHTRGDYGLNLN